MDWTAKLPFCRRPIFCHSFSDLEMGTMRSSSWIVLALVAMALVAPILATEIVSNDEDEQKFEIFATYQGKMSTFGGPNDHGVSPSEGTCSIEVGWWP